MDSGNNVTLLFYYALKLSRFQVDSGPLSGAEWQREVTRYNKSPWLAAKLIQTQQESVSSASEGSF